MGRKDKIILPDDALELGARMRIARQQKDISLTQMAKLVNYTKSHLSATENGTARPSLDLVRRYEEKLGLAIGELIQILQEGKDEKKEEDIYQPSFFEKGARERATGRKSTRESWGEAPTVEMFYGRQQELSTLTNWIVGEHCRLITIQGIGGVGKTSLAVKLATQIKHHFDCIFWYSLQSIPPLAQVLEKCVLFVSNQSVSGPPKDVEDLLDLLIQYLQDYKCLIILDNFESVLQERDRAERLRRRYQGYGRLLQRVGEAGHNSCLLLPSREKPRELMWLEGDKTPVRSLQLHGIESNEARKILEQNKLALDVEEDWSQLIRHYDGNPLALRLISAHIRKVFGGSIRQFLEIGEAVFGDIYDLLAQQFVPLSKTSKDIMYWLAIEQNDVTLPTLRDILVPKVSMSDLQESFDSLLRLSLIEEAKGGSAEGFHLLPVISEYIIKDFLEKVIADIDEEEFTVLQSHTLVNAQSKEYTRNAQTQLILKPVVIHLVTTLGIEESKRKLRSMLSVLREHIHTPGYAAGNILNLLIQLDTDLRSYDFSHMAIWRTYLQGQWLPEVNFAYANLENSIFTNTFGSILSVALSPDNTLLAAGTANGEIWMWSFPDGTPRHTYRGHTDWVTTLAFSSDGKLLASGSDDKTIRTWSTETDTRLRVLEGYTDWIRSVSFSPDNNLLASGSDDKMICIWDVKTGERIRTIYEHESRVYSVAFSPDGRLLASSGEDHKVRLWSINGEECLQVLQGHESRVYSVVFSPDGRQLFSGSDDQKIRIWETGTWQCLRVLEGHSGGIQSLCISSDGEMLASSSVDTTVKVWKTQTGECLRTLLGHLGSAWSAVFSSDKALLMSGSNDQTIRIWEVDTGNCLKTLHGYGCRAYSLVFSPDGKILACSTEDQKIRLWRVSTGECIRVLDGYSTWRYSLAFSPDGTLLASGNEDQKIRLWDVNTGERMHVLQGENNWVRSVAFSPDGEILACGMDDLTVRLWKVKTEKSLQVLYGHKSWVRSVAFSPDGELLASGSDDHTIRLWHVSTGKQQHIFNEHLKGVYDIAFSPDGIHLVSGSGDQTIRIWQTQTGICERVLQGHTHWVWSVTFSKDGKRIVSGSEDQTIRVWNVETGDCLQKLEEQNSSIQYVAFSPDNDFVASGGLDGELKLLEISTGICIRTLRNNRPYEGMNITGAQGLTEGQKTMLKELGAIEN